MWHLTDCDTHTFKIITKIIILFQNVNNTRLRNLVGQDVNETQYEWYPVNLNAVRGAFDNILENFE